MVGGREGGAGSRMEGGAGGRRGRGWWEEGEGLAVGGVPNQKSEFNLSKLSLLRTQCLVCIIIHIIIYVLFGAHGEED